GAAQTGSVPVVQLPALQVSAPLQKRPSSQCPGARHWTQASRTSSQYGLGAAQAGGVPVVQLPALQVSAPLQKRPSSQSGADVHPASGTAGVAASAWAIPLPASRSTPGASMSRAVERNAAITAFRSALPG